MSERREWGTPGFDEALAAFDSEVASVIRLSARLCVEPGVTIPAHRADLPAVQRTLAIAAERARALGLDVRVFDADEAHPYPLLVAWSPGADPHSPEVNEAVVLVGHLDVVAADDAQWRPFLVGDELHARGATDMKTVAATFLEWMGARGALAGGPARVLVLSGCEENGSVSPWSAKDALQWLEDDCGCRVRFAIVGERTGELEWMRPAPLVGPVCRENRSWRWTRCSVGSRGSEAVSDIAAVVHRGRHAVLALNTERLPADKASRQPGLRSGWLCSFAWVPGEDPNGDVLRFDRPSGASMHAAAADVSAPSCVEVLAVAFETLHGVATDLSAEIALAALSIGEDGNFNSTDGSGRLWVSWNGRGLPEGLARVRERLPHLQVEIGSSTDVPRGPTEAVFGLDIRELLDHKEPVEALLADLAATPGLAVQRVNARPSWRCPDDHPDLVALLDAWASVVGAPSPDLVKLHGNDGGLIAARAGSTGWAPAVVFGQVGARPHGPDETHACGSIQPYWDILDAFADRVWG
jgi:acetylornithine deacetylase/succinyl-diaminopimelate desuccinylase-like protein